MSATYQTDCPHCDRDLAANQRGKHCKSPACNWLVCKCKSTVEIRSGRHICPEKKMCHKNIK